MAENNIKDEKKQNEIDKAIRDLESIATHLNEEGWYTKANKVDNAILKIKELTK